MFDISIAHQSNIFRICNNLKRTSILGLSVLQNAFASMPFDPNVRNSWSHNFTMVLVVWLSVFPLRLAKDSESKQIVWLCRLIWENDDTISGIYEDTLSILTQLFWDHYNSSHSFRHCKYISTDRSYIMQNYRWWRRNELQKEPSLDVECGDNRFAHRLTWFLHKLPSISCSPYLSQRLLCVPLSYHTCCNLTK